MNADKSVRHSKKGRNGRGCARNEELRGKKKTKTLIDQPGVQYMAKYIFFIFRKYQFVQSDHDECDRGRYT